MKILATDGMEAGAAARLRGDGHEVVERFCGPEALGAVLRDFDAVVVRFATEIRRPQIDAARGGRLRLIVRAGVGVDNIDVVYAEAAGIQVRNTPRASSNAVAELAIALLFSCARNISIAGYAMREGKREEKAHSQGFELAGRTMGIIGYGRIGRMVGEKARALGMNVLAALHRGKPEGVEAIPMDELLARADAIVLCAPSGSRPLIDAGAIDKMKAGAVLVNVSRGANVDEAALLEALNGGKIKAAGLDVWLNDQEPNRALVQHPAVSCTPHVGAWTQEAQRRVGAELVEILEGFGGEAAAPARS